MWIPVPQESELTEQELNEDLPTVFPLVLTNPAKAFTNTFNSQLAGHFMPG